MPSVAPIASAAHSFVARGFTATPTITQTRKKVPIPSTTIPGRIASFKRAETAAMP